MIFSSLLGLVRRKETSPDKILEDKSLSTDEKIKRLYELVLSKTKIHNLKGFLSRLEKILDRIPWKYEQARKDIMTLESVIRARLDYDTGQQHNPDGTVSGYINFFYNPSFKDYLRQDTFHRGVRLYEKDYKSPITSEEGTFHYASLLKFKVLLPAKPHHKK